MITLRDISLPACLSKKKKIQFYKAFILKDGESMVVNEDCDICGLTPEAAIQYMLYSTNPEDCQHLTGTTICFAIFEVDRNILNTTPLVDTGDVYNKDDNISITLKGKPYKIDVMEKVIEDIEVEIGDRNEIKLISNIKLT